MCSYIFLIQKYKSVIRTQGNSPPSYPRVHLYESLSHPESDITVVTTPEQSIFYHMPEEEIRYVDTYVLLFIINVSLCEIM